MNLLTCYGSSHHFATAQPYLFTKYSIFRAFKVPNQIILR
uniref:Uncharacterized protein n=1 Tax=Arundo donax TaxID=35708 RepID=A0A0A9ETX6_ARUDO